MVVLGSHLNNTVGIIMPTFEDVKRIRKEFGMLVDTIPDFLMPEVRYSTIRDFEFGDNRYWWMHGRNASKGRTLSQLYLSSRLTEEDLKDHLFSLIPAMSFTAGGVNNIHTFDDI